MGVSSLLARLSRWYYPSNLKVKNDEQPERRATRSPVWAGKARARLKAVVYSGSGPERD